MVDSWVLRLDLEAEERMKGVGAEVATFALSDWLVSDTLLADGPLLSKFDARILISVLRSVLE